MVPIGIMDKSIHLRMPKVLYREASEIKEHFGFTNMQEFIKEAIRKAIFEYNKQKALKTLKRLYGSVKDTKRFTDKERNKLAMEHTPEKGREILKKYGLI